MSLKLGIQGGIGTFSMDGVEGRFQAGEHLSGGKWFRGNHSLEGDE